nr:ATP-binding cassette sub-family D member 3-like [Lytechinus pictus]
MISKTTQRQGSAAYGTTPTRTAANLQAVIHNNEKNKSKKDRAAVDTQFFRRLFRILRLIVPGLWSKETGYLALVALSLIARTYCDVWMIQNGTAIER